MARVKLTTGRINALALPKGVGQAFLWDSDTKQLAVRVTQGMKAYIFQGRINDKSLRITIGSVKDWSIDKAREEARRLQTMIDKGDDPRQVKAEQEAVAKARDEAQRQQEARESLTVAKAWAAYIEARRHKWSARHLADHQNLANTGGVKRQKGGDLTVAGALAALMNLNLAQLDADHVKAWLRDEAARRPTQAAIAYRLLRAFLNWCNDTPAYRGIAAADACRVNVARDTLPKQKAKTDCLQKEQLPAWFAAVRGIGNPVIAAYLQALLLTGARREELLGLKWDDVDFRWGTLTIRDKAESKGGEDGERTIPLTPYVASLLAALPRRNEWVFSSTASASGRLQEPSIRHRKATAIAGIESLTLHGLRRSFASLAEWVEMPAGVTAQIQGHKPSAIAEKHYKRRPLDLLRLWHCRYEAWILEQAGIEFRVEQPGLKLVTAA